MSASTTLSGRLGVLWSWSGAALGLAYAAPAAALTVVDPQRGLLVALGSLCAAAVGLPPRRRDRILTVVVGTLMGVGLFLGSLLGGLPHISLLMVFVLSVVAAVSAPLVRVGGFLLILALPALAAGLDIASPSAGVGAALLILAGATCSWALSLLWPADPDPVPRRTRPGVPRGILLDYGVRLGLTAVVALAGSLLLGIEHAGWAAAAALMVGGPNAAAATVRVGERCIAVLAGSAAALALHGVGAPPVLLAAGVALALLLATLADGRWSAGLTAFLLLTMLLAQGTATGSWWWLERLGGLALGVCAAWLLLAQYPAWRSRSGADAPEAQALTPTAASTSSVEATRVATSAGAQPSVGPLPGTPRSDAPAAPAAGPARGAAAAGPLPPGAAAGPSSTAAPHTSTLRAS